MKKNVLVLVLCVSILNLVLPATSVSATSVGKSCSKAGALAGTKKSPLVCKKVGKKLIWQKDFVTTTATTTTATTTTATTTTVALTTTTTVAPTTSVLSVPAAPTGLTFVLSSPFNRSITFSWTDNSSNEDNFQYCFDDPTKNIKYSQCYSRSSARIPSNTTFVTISNITEKFGCFWLSARNRAGFSSWAGPVCNS